MRLRQLLYFVFPATVLLLASCEGNTDSKWLIHNLSSTDLQVQAHLVYTDDTLEFSIAPNEAEIFNLSNQLGGNPNPYEPEWHISQLLVINTNGDTLNKDFELISSWGVVINQVKKIPSHYDHTYTLVVSDSDF